MQNFEILCKLGDGAYSQVYKVKRKKDGKVYAMKKVKIGALNEKEKENALNEVRILASIRHPNIISWKDTFLDGQILCIVMEFADGGDLYAVIQKHQKARSLPQEEEIWNWGIQLIMALKALHDMKILHRDLKCANVFVNKDGVVKLGDLNVSKVAKKQLAYTQTGTPYYASPEVWKDQPYDAKSDIWSLGCVLYELASLQPPFRAQDMQGLYRAVLKGQYEPLKSYSQEFNNLIKSLLVVNPSQRPSCDQLLAFPSVQKRMGNLKVTPLINKSSNNNELLGTIKVPRNLVLLADRLPQPNYEDIQKEIPEIETSDSDQEYKMPQQSRVRKKIQAESQSQEQESAQDNFEQRGLRHQVKSQAQKRDQYDSQNYIVHSHQHNKQQPLEKLESRPIQNQQRSPQQRENANQREIYSRENSKKNLIEQNNQANPRENPKKNNQAEQQIHNVNREVPSRQNRLMELQNRPNSREIASRHNNQNEQHDRPISREAGSRQNRQVEQPIRPPSREMLNKQINANDQQMRPPSREILNKQSNVADQQIRPNSREMLNKQINANDQQMRPPSREILNKQSNVVDQQIRPNSREQAGRQKIQIEQQILPASHDIAKKQNKITEIQQRPNSREILTRQSNLIEQQIHPVSREIPGGKNNLNEQQIRPNSRDLNNKQSNLNDLQARPNSREIANRQNYFVDLQNRPNSRELQSKQQAQKQQQQVQNVGNIKSPQKQVIQNHPNLANNRPHSREPEIILKDKLVQDNLLARYKPSAQQNLQQYNQQPQIQLQRQIQSQQQQIRPKLREKNSIIVQPVLHRPQRDKTHLANAAKGIINQQIPIQIQQPANQNGREIMTPGRICLDNSKKHIISNPYISPQRATPSREKNAQLNVGYYNYLQSKDPSTQNMYKQDQKLNDIQNNLMSNYRNVKGENQHSIQLQAQNMQLVNNISRLNSQVPGQMPHTKIQPIKLANYDSPIVPNKTPQFMQPSKEVKLQYQNLQDYNFLQDRNCKPPSQQSKRGQSAQASKPVWWG